MEEYSVEGNEHTGKPKKGLKERGVNAWHCSKWQLVIFFFLEIIKCHKCLEMISAYVLGLFCKFLCLPIMCVGSWKHPGLLSDLRLLFHLCLSKLLSYPAGDTLLFGWRLAPGPFLLVTSVNSVMVCENRFMTLISLLVVVFPSS